METADALYADHQAALDAYLAAIQTLDASAWNRVPGPERWSPAQVTEHLRLTYVTVRAELAGEGGFRVRTRWWQQRLYQWMYLPRILREGRFPRRVPAVREIRPGPGPYDRTALLAALRTLGEECARELVRAPVGARGFRHPFLGRLPPTDALRVLSQHIRHHQKQVEPQAG